MPATAMIDVRQRDARKVLCHGKHRDRRCCLSGMLAPVGAYSIMDTASSDTRWHITEIKQLFSERKYPNPKLAADKSMTPYSLWRGRSVQPVDICIPASGVIPGELRICAGQFGSGKADQPGAAVRLPILTAFQFNIIYRFRPIFVTFHYTITAAWTYGSCIIQRTSDLGGYH